MPDPTTIGTGVGTAIAAAAIAAWKVLKGRKRAKAPESTPPPKLHAPVATEVVNEVRALADALRQLTDRVHKLEDQSLHYINDEEFGVAQRENNETIRRLTAEANRAIGRLESWVEIMERERNEQRQSAPEVKAK